ncbi:hypothetical protein [Amycolatopsis sp. NPDC059657]|uniref:hypothetical protein n=1 Tax=Amycolatopsis sp. NPDC059657 TaxID=3346899 RepID=UPI00366A9A52
MSIQVDLLPVRAGLPMGGYGWSVDRRSDGSAANPLKIRCVILVSQQGQRIVLVQTDIISIPRPLYQRILSRLVAAGVVSGAQNFVLAQSHTHYGPMVGDKPDPYVLLGSEQAAADAKAYTDEFVEAIVRTSVAAHNKPLVEVTLGYAEGYAEVGENRLVPEASTIGKGAPHEVPVLVAQRTDNRDLFAVLAGHVCHPVCAAWASTALDADFCGWAVDNAEKRLGAPVVFFQGAAGDVDPRNPPPGEDKVAFWGTRLADAVVATVRNAAHFPITGPITTAITEAKLPYAVDFGDGTQVDALRKKYQDRITANDESPIGQAGVRHAKRMIAELDAGNRPGYLPMTVQKLDLGGLTILTMSHEVLSGYHVGTKRNFAAKYGTKPLWVMAYAHHIDCYVPAYDVLSEGGRPESGWAGDPKIIGVGTYGLSYSLLAPLSAGASANDPNGVEAVVVQAINQMLGLS